MKHKAVYFDRDGTLSRQDPEIIAERDHRISEIVGREIVVDEVLNRAAFVAVWDEHPELEPVRDMQTEDAFWQQWFAMLLTKLGVTQGVTEHAKRLFQQYPFYKIMTPFPETLSVLKFIRGVGLPMGVISDTFPSLELTLKLMGIRHFFDSVTASSLVGFGKPDPRIFRHALSQLNVTAEESIFVDDTEDEAVGARHLGFTSFYLDRSQQSNEEWTISSLEEMVRYIQMAT